jgi:hypothetical protein
MDMKLNEALEKLQSAGALVESVQKINTSEIDSFIRGANQLKAMWLAQGEKFTAALDEAGISDYKAALEINDDSEDFALTLRIYNAEDWLMEVSQDEEEGSEDIFIIYDLPGKHGSVRSTWEQGPSKVVRMITDGDTDYEE